jgi:hypothetical protein
LTELCSICLGSELDPLRVVGVEAISEFAPVFSHRNIPELMILNSQLLELAQHLPSRELFLSYATFLGSIHDTSEIFSDLVITIFPTETAALYVAPEALDCIRAAMTSAGDTVDPFVCHILQLITACVNSCDESHAVHRISALYLLEQLIRCQGSQILIDPLPFFTLISNEMHSDDPNRLLASLSILRTVLDVSLNSSTVVWDALDFPLLLHLAGSDWSGQLREVMANEISEGEVPLIVSFQLSARALQILSRSVVLNDAVFKSHVNDVISICNLQLESVEPECITAACQAMIDVIQAKIKVRVLEDDVVSMILVALARAAAGWSQPIPKIRNIIFDLNLPIQNMLEIAAILVDAMECPDIPDKNDVVMLVMDLVRKAARVDTPGTVAFARQCAAEIESPEASPIRRFDLLFVLGITILALPHVFDRETKRNIIGAAIEGMLVIQHELAGVLLLSALVTADADSIDPFAQGVLTTLVREATTFSGDELVVEIAVIGLMQYLMRLTTSENVGELGETFGIVLSRLPLSHGVLQGQMEMGRFLSWLCQQTTGCHRDVLRICIEWFAHGVEPACLLTLRTLLVKVIEALPDSEAIIGEICGDDQLVVQNLQDLLAMTD